jgi:uncharacterized membrane-anchored protein YhcB (DUF1043 family)
MGKTLMFREWGFLLAEIWVLLALAAVLGVFVGWLFWGAGRLQRLGDAGPANRSGPAAGAEVLRLKAALETCAAERNRALARNAALGAELETARAALGPQLAREAADQIPKRSDPAAPEVENAARHSSIV